MILHRLFTTEAKRFEYTNDGPFTLSILVKRLRPEALILMKQFCQLPDDLLWAQFNEGIFCIS